MPEISSKHSKHAEKTAHLDVGFGGYSDKGKKLENQDAFAAQQPNKAMRETKGCVVCIADGVSCSDNAKEASQLSVTTFINDYYSTPDAWSVKDSVARVLSSLNTWLYQHGQNASYKQNRLVTTFSGIVFKSTTAYLYHIGDSRIYHLRDGQLRSLTKDHVQFTSKEDSFLIRALGMDTHLEVDFSKVELQLGDRFLLTTDGVHETFSLEQLQQMLTRVDLGLEQLAKEICQKAEHAGSEDNLSCFIAEVKSLPQMDINEVSRQLTALQLPPILKSGQKLDDFRITKVLHSGTRSHVYLAKHEPTNDNYVLKAPAQNYSDDLTYLEGFMREQWVGSRINNKGVMKIWPRTEFQQNSPFLYHVCEAISGITLRQWMYDNPSPSLNQVRTVVSEIISAIRVLQRNSMVHRDLKPENIMITETGKVKLIDFGTVQVAGLEEIKSVIKEDRLAGAVGYIAPEYLLGQKGVHRSDIFSLGVMVYEMISGELPFKTPLILRSQVQSLDHWKYQSITNTHKQIPLWLDQALKKATEPNVSQRYVAMSEFLMDLKTPNTALLQKIDAAPLIERNPIGFWKLLSLVLFMGLILQTIWIHG